MPSNYPPGVTGNELEIAGPDYEEELDERCTSCGETQVELGYGRKRWIVCRLGHITNLEN